MKDEDWELDTITVWYIALNDLQITPDEFMTAKRKTLSMTWPPTAPADFLELARGKVTDSYPDMRQAYIDQANLKGDCPIAYETARRVGFSVMRERPEHITYPLWRKHYTEVCKAHSEGETFNKPQVPQIAYKTPANAADDATAAKMLADIRAILAGDQK